MTVPVRILKSVCALDCPDACSLEITVEDGKVVHLTGTPPNEPFYLMGRLPKA